MISSNLFCLLLFFLAFNDCNLASPDPSQSKGRVLPTRLSSFSFFSQYHASRSVSPRFSASFPVFCPVTAAPWICHRAAVRAPAARNTTPRTDAAHTDARCSMNACHQHNMYGLDEYICMCIYTHYSHATPMHFEVEKRGHRSAHAICTHPAEQAHDGLRLSDELLEVEAPSRERSPVRARTVALLHVSARSADSPPRAVCWPT